MKRKIIIVCGIIIIVVFTIVFKSFSGVNEPCDWCGEKPSKAYKISDGSKSYVCKDCRMKCAWCDSRAKKHYESGMGMMVFVCNDCFEDINE